MAHILLIETATDICSVGICHTHDGLRTVRNNKGQHASQITILIAEAVAEAGIAMSDLQAVAISSGPGSYTSLRVGTSAAKGICFALQIPLIAIDTLSALAQAARLETPADYYVPMIDARRMEVYTATYNHLGELQSSAEAKIVDQNSYLDLLESGKKIVFCGDGAPKCSTTITHPNAIFLPLLCDAMHLAASSIAQFEAGSFVDMAYYTPFYLKPPNITASKPIL